MLALDKDGLLPGELKKAGSKLVVVDFTAEWCPPCQGIAPHFERLSKKYTSVVFLKVDVDKCPQTAQANQVQAMPTFLFFRNQIKIDRCQGADVQLLESTINRHSEALEGGDGEGTTTGHMDLHSLIALEQCECFNESNDHTFKNCLTAESGYLESDCDEQLILSITFRQPVKIHSLKFKAPADKGPKYLKLFINQPITIDFEKANDNVCVQDLTLTPEDCEEGKPLELRYVKFQNVQNLQIFVKDNQTSQETTQIDHLVIYGSPISTTNMGDFKRVAGKKGESH